MIAPSTITLLDLWEQHQRSLPPQQALALLAAACPDDPPEALARQSIGERDRQLFQLRGALFGPRMPCTTECPRCASRLELDVAIAEVLAAGAEPVPESLSVASNGIHATIRLPTSADLLALPPNISNTFGLLERCVLEAHTTTGETVERLPETVLAEVAAAMARADPLADIRFDLDCPQCGHSWQAPFDIVAFLWHELDAWVRRLLQEIHTLAAAYGWSERDILLLSPRRRAMYLQLVNDERLPV